jgi:hypothetical protein
VASESSGLDDQEKGVSLGPAFTAAVLFAIVAVVRKSRRAALVSAGALTLELFPPYRKLLRRFVRRVTERAEEA